MNPEAERALKRFSPAQRAQILRDYPNLGGAPLSDHIKPSRKKHTGYDGAAALSKQLDLAGHPHVLELRFHPTRLWRIDIAFPAEKLAVEYEGFGKRGSPGRHQRPQGFREDCVKYRELLKLGWRLIRVEQTLVKSGQAFAWVVAALAE